MIAFLFFLQISVTSPSDSILAVLHHQQDAWNRGDIRAYMDGYWKSDSLVFTSGGTVNRGWDATLRKYLRTYDTPEAMGRLTFDEISVTLLSDGAAAVIGRWMLERTDDRPSGVFTLVFRRFPEGWKIIVDHTSLKRP